jgi:hypothetical protein
MFIYYIQYIYPSNQVNSIYEKVKKYFLKKSINKYLTS